MIRPTNRYKYDEQEHIKYVLDDLDSADLILDDMILDNPKRAIVRCAKNHAALYACEYYKHKAHYCACLLYTSPSPRDLSTSRMPSSA